MKGLFTNGSFAMRRSRAVGGGLLVIGVWFALFGGEYSTFDWWRLRRSVAQETAEIARLQVEVDSLTRVLELLRGDSAMQERIARERFGMIRDGEILYKLVPEN